MSVDLPEIANLNYSPPGRFVIFCNSNNKDQESENRKRVRPDCDFFNCAAGLIASKAGRLESRDCAARRWRGGAIDARRVGQ